jgi:hypothetical protein
MSAVVALALLCLLPITRLLTIYTPAERLIYFLAGIYESNGLVGLPDVDFAVKRLILAGLLRRRSVFCVVGEGPPDSGV